MPTTSVESPEVVLELERFLLGPGEILRGSDEDAGDSRQRLLHVGVLIQNGRDVWFELRAEQRKHAPAQVFFSIRFVAEDGLETGCEAALVIAGAAFRMRLDEQHEGACAIEADQVLDPKSKRVRKPIQIALDCPGATDREAIQRT